MGKYQLIALDMDGTLLNSELKLTQRTREAIALAHKNGKHVVLSTGRCLSEMRDVLQALPEVRYAVCENGCCVYDCQYERTLHCDPVPKEEVMHILELMRKERVVIQVFSDNQSYVNQKDDSWMESCRMQRYRESFRSSAVLDAKLFDRYDERPFVIEKVNLYFDSAAARTRARLSLADRPIQAIETMVYLLECFSPKADKGRGLQMLCRHLNVAMENVIAVGDSRNDIEMLSAAGLSVAMGNAGEDVKAAAQLVTADCDHDGVAEVIEKYLLNL